MANYSLVINSQFKPFSYQEMLAPTLMATQAHQELENQYGELATKASVWEEMANEQTDPYAYKMYKTYANDLEEQAGQLAREGLNAASRRDMLNMRARYSKEITPIEQAYTARQKQAEQQQQALLQDPTLLLSRRASTTSLDDYIRNPQLAYETYSGKLITAQAASAASALAKEMQEKPRKWRSILGNSYYETMMQKGFSSQAVLQAIQDNPDAAPQLTRIVEDAINSSGVRDWGDQATIARAIDYAKQGLWSAVGETQYQTLDNWRAKMAEQEAMQKRAEKRAAAAKEAESNKYKVNPLPLRSEQEIGASNKKVQDYINKGYLKRTKAGLTITQRGLSELRGANRTPIVQSWESYKRQHPGATKSSYDTMVAEVKSIASRPSEFYQWYNKNIGGYNIRTGKVATPTTRLNAYEHSIKQGSYDVYHSTEYDRQLPSTYGTEYTKQIWSAAPTKDGEKYLQGIDFNGKNGWSNTKKYTKEDLEDYEVTNIRHSRWGDTAILQSSKSGKNDVIRVKIPKGINIGAETNVRNAISNADYWGSILHKNRRPMIDRSGNIATDTKGNIIYSNSPLTEADKIDLKRKQDAALQDIYGYGSQTVVPSVTSNEQISPWY
nr:MAG TPA: hypothetical protein [Crassvirales sp.]